MTNLFGNIDDPVIAAADGVTTVTFMDMGPYEPHNIDVSTFNDPFGAVVTVDFKRTNVIKKTGVRKTYTDKVMVPGYFNIDDVVAQIVDGKLVISYVNTVFAKKDVEVLGA